MGFEQQLAQHAFNQRAERTFIDKILAKADVEKVQDLIKKPKLKRQDLLELLYMLSSTESKLLNLSQWDRYVLMKFFVWIREFIKIAELLYDYQDDLREKKRNGIIQLSKRTEKLLYNNERLIEHNAKFLIDLYFNMGRSTLSVGMSAFIELLTSKFEMSYPNLNPLATPIQGDNTGGVYSMGKRGIRQN